MENAVVEIVINNDITMEFELYPEHAPQSVYNFVKLAKEGFYDGLIMHRVIKDFVAQGGDPEGSGMGGPGYSIKGEFLSNGHANGLLHEKGSISFARSMMPNSAGSQFYIALADINFLDGEYATFGKIIKGDKHLDFFNNLQTGADDRPQTDIIIKSIRVINDVDYPNPEEL